MHNCPLLAGFHLPPPLSKTLNSYPRPVEMDKQQALKKSFSESSSD